MDKDELKSLLGSDNLIILDVRIGRDWNSSEFKIKDAVRMEGFNLSAIEKYPKDATLVLYCAWPSEYTSARVARKVIDEGYSKVYALKGGWKEWFDAKYPVEDK